MHNRETIRNAAAGLMNFMRNMGQSIGTPAGIPSQPLERRPDIRQAEDNVRYALANVGVANANFFPRVGLTTLFGRLELEGRFFWGTPRRTPWTRLDRLHRHRIKDQPLDVEIGGQPSEDTRQRRFRADNSCLGGNPRCIPKIRG